MQYILINYLQFNFQEILEKYNIYKTKFLIIIYILIKNNVNILEILKFYIDL